MYTVNVTSANTLILGSQASASTPMLLINTDSTNTVWVGSDPTIYVSAPNAIPLGPGTSLAFGGQVTAYGVTNGPVVVVAVVPQGTQYFLPASLNNLGGSKVYVQAGQPTGNIPVNSIWFDTANDSLLTWTGSAWVNESFNAQFLINDATILGSQLADGTLTTTQIAAAAGILGSQIADATITSGNIAANTIVAANIAANTITAAQIAANTITAGQIAANTITTEQLAATAINGMTISGNIIESATIEAGTIIAGSVLPGSAMNANPFFAGGDTTGWASASGSVETELTSSVAAGGPAYQYCAYCTAAGASGYELQVATKVPCTAGQQYQLSAWVYTTATTVGLYATFTGASTIFNGVTTTADAWNFVETVITAPSGATAIGAEFECDSVAYWTACQITPEVPGALIAGELVGNTIVAEGSNGGYYLYSGTPASGNLAASLTAVSGKDTYGNTVYSGFVAYGSGNAYAGIGPYSTTALLALNPETGYTGNNISYTVPQIITESVNEGSSTEEYLGIGINSGGPVSSSVTNGSQLWLYGGSPDGTTNVPYMALFGDTTNRVIGEWSRSGINVYDSTGTAWQAAISQTSTNTVTNANNGEAQITTAWAIHANDPAVGTTYEIETNISGTMEGETLEFVPYIGTSIPSWSGGTTCGASWIASGEGFTGWLKLRIIFTATGSSGRCDVFLTGMVGYNGTRSSGSNGNFLALSGQSTGVAFNTTSSSNLVCIYSIWGASASGQTVTGKDDTFTRKGSSYS